jgi:hypothetical protein
VRQQGGFLAVMLLLLAVSRRSIREQSQAGACAVLVAWALAALGLYALVYTEARYVAPFLVLLWSAALACVRLPQSPSMPSVASAGAWLLAGFTWMNIAALNLEGASGLVGFAPKGEQHGAVIASSRLRDGQRMSHPAIAEGLARVGVGPGTPVAFIGYSYSAYWARLARVRIVAEIRPDEAERFWEVGAERRAGAIRAIREAGIPIVIAEPPVPEHLPEGWFPLASTGVIATWTR